MNSLRKVNTRKKGELHYSVQRGTIEQREQVSLRCERSLGTLKTQPVCKATCNTATSHTCSNLLLLLIKFNQPPVCLCSNFLRTILEIARTRHRFCMHCMPFIVSVETGRYELL